MWGQCLATLSSVVAWKAENVPNKRYDLVKNISKQNVEGAFSVFSYKCERREINRTV